MEEKGKGRAISATTPAEGDLVEWMRAYQGGDRDAFRRIYDHLAPRLRGYLISLTFNPTLAEDLLQETFLRMHRARRSYRPPLPVVPWAFAIARNCFRMERRAFFRKWDREDGLEGLEELPLQQLFDRVDHVALREALEALGEDSREVVLLHHLWGFAFKDVAAMLGVSEGGARLKAHRAILQLRKRLES